MNRRGYIALSVIAVAAVLTVVLVLTLRRPAPEPVVVVPEPKYIIALDPGHGGRDPGAVVGDVLEKNLNLTIVQKIQSLILSDPQFRTVMTRSVDVYVSFEDRVRRAEEAGATIYVCVHVNSFDLPEVNGIETWVDNTRADADPSWVFASMIQDAVSTETGARNRGIRTQESYLQRTKMPAVSVEVGYMTNPDELAKLLDPTYQDKIALGVLNGVRQFIAWQEQQKPASSPAT